MREQGLFVREVGPAGAPTIVFLHGGGLGGWMWDPQVAALSRSYHCLVPDLPEQGESRNAGPFTIRGAADAVADLIRDRTHNGSASVVGLSLGAQVAVELLSRHPDLIQRAIVSGTSVYPIPGIGLVKLLVWLYQPFKNLPFVVRASMRAFGIPEQYLSQFREAMRRLSARALNRALAENAAFRLPDNLREIQTPTLVVVGENENRAVYASAHDLGHALPHATAVVALGQGHVWNLTAPDLYADMIGSWVEDRPLPTGLEQLR